MAKLKTKLSKLGEASTSFEKCEVPSIAMKAVGYEDHEIELLITLSMFGKPAVHVPLSFAEHANLNNQKHKVEKAFYEESLPKICFPEAQ